MKFEEYRLGDLIESISVTHKFPRREIIFLNTSDILEGSVLTDEFKDVVGLPGQAKKSMKKGDILYSEIRPKNKRYAFIDFDAENYVVSTKLMVLRVKAPRLLNNKYLYYYLTCNNIVNHLQNLAESRSGTFPQITYSEIASLDIALPTLQTQNRVVDFMDDLNDKLKVNNAIIFKLEELAQTLFKHWFVDFEFPNEEGKPYKSSGGKMVESELGVIPEGWGVTNIQSMPVIISDHVANGSFASIKKNVQIVEDEDYALFLRNTDLKQDLQGERRYVTKSSYDFLKKTQLFGGEVIISNVGDVGTIHRCPSLNRPMVLGNNLIVIQPIEQNEVLNTYFYFLFKSFEGKKLIKSITSGSVQMKFNKTDFRNLKIVIPESFEKMNMNILKKILLKVDLLKQEIESLSKLRDTLLPKLLSGEIELPDDMEVTGDVPIS